MFGFFKKKDSSPPRTSEAVINLLETMGYTITNDGIGMIALELASDYSAAEVASHIILVTIALDVQESSVDNADLIKLMEIASSSITVSKSLKFFVENKWMHPTQYQNDNAAIAGVSIVGPEQLSWVEKILSDPMINGKRLAIRS